MKFQIDKDSFLKVLQRVQGIVEKRNTMPILANILLKAKSGKIEVMATDLEVSIKDVCDAAITKEGNITINARKLFEIVKEAPADKVEISADDSGKITIKSGKARFTIVGLPVEEFPAFPAYSEGELSRIAPEILKEMIEKTAFAASTDETRYNINGVFVEKDGANVRMVATDGHRLSFVEKSSEWPNLDKGVILPRKGIVELKRFLDDGGTVSLAFTANSAVVRKDETVIIIRLIDGEFPDYKQVIPKNNDKRIKIERTELLNSLKRVSLLSLEKGRGVKFGFSKGKLELSSSNPDIGEAKEEIDIDYGKGDGFEVGFNASYFMDALSVLEKDKVVLELKDRESPALLKSDNADGFAYVIMPMRI